MELGRTPLPLTSPAPLQPPTAGLVSADLRSRAPTVQGTVVLSPTILASPSCLCSLPPKLDPTSPSPDVLTSFLPQIPSTPCPRLIQKLRPDCWHLSLWLAPRFLSTLLSLSLYIPTCPPLSCQTRPLSSSLGCPPRHPPMHPPQATSKAAPHCGLP